MWSPPHLPHHPHWPGHNQQVRRQLTGFHFKILGELGVSATTAMTSSGFCGLDDSSFRRGLLGEMMLAWCRWRKRRRRRRGKMKIQSVIMAVVKGNKKK